VPAPRRSDRRQVVEQRLHLFLDGGVRLVVHDRELVVRVERIILVVGRQTRNLRFHLACTQDQPAYRLERNRELHHRNSLGTLSAPNVKDARRFRPLCAASVDRASALL
jgi:hypothetical protein